MMSVTPYHIDAASDELDQVLYDLLRDSVRGKAPSTEVRDALLHAAALERQQTLEAYQAAQDTAESWNQKRQAYLSSAETLGMLQAYFQRMRFVI
jgi:hypothetical protein